MKTVFLVITDNGDGSNSIEWHKSISKEKLACMKQQDQYQSGDGVQVTELKFPDILDLDNFAHVNNITWYEDMEPDYDPEDCEECGCPAGDFGPEDYDSGHYKCPDCGAVC